MSIFVGRAEQKQQVLESLRHVEKGIVYDIVGVHGIGKSTFLTRVRDEAMQFSQPPEIYEVDLTERGLALEFGPETSSTITATLWQTFVRARNLMLKCADHFTKTVDRCHDFDDFKLRVEKVSKDADRFLAEQDFRLKDSGSSSVFARNEAVLERLRAFQRSVDESFLNAWEDFTARRKALFLVDSFESFAFTELGRWLIDMALRMPNTLTLFARVPTGTRTELAQYEQLQQVDLGYFSFEEVQTYLRLEFPQESLKHGVAEMIYRYTDGHPGGMALTARLISEKGSDIDPRELRRLLDRLPDDRRQRWSSLVHLIVETVRDPLLREAVDAASVTWSFDGSLLAALLGVPDDGPDVRNAVNALAAYRLTQRVLADVRGNRFRLIEFIRLSLGDDLRVNSLSRWESLNGRAAAHYFELLQQDEASYPDDPYHRWYRYEKQAWQANKQDWLYHSGQLRGRKDLTRARFVLVFLEAFWWYGCYYPFPFNAQLLLDWERATNSVGVATDAAESQKDEALTAHLRFLLEKYPLGPDKDSADWDSMRDHLLDVRRLCGLEPGRNLPVDPEESQQLRRTRGMITLFLAHTRRYRDPDDPRADHYYSEARTDFEDLGDTWLTAWLVFEVADLALKRDQPAAAISLVRHSARTGFPNVWSDEQAYASSAPNPGTVATADFDFELLANLHRVRAEALCQLGQTEAAGTAYGQSVAAAYWFQGRPHAPDGYTHRFYLEILSAASKWVPELVLTDGDLATRFLQRICKELPEPSSQKMIPSALMSADITKAVTALFPSPPDPATDLNDESSNFMTILTRLWDENATTPIVGLRALQEEL